MDPFAMVMTTVYSNRNRSTVFLLPVSEAFTAQFWQPGHGTWMTPAHSLVVE